MSWSHRTHSPLPRLRSLKVPPPLYHHPGDQGPTRETLGDWSHPKPSHALIWKWAVCRCNQVMMRSYWIRVWDSDPVTDILIRGGKFGCRYAGEVPCGDGGRGQSDGSPGEACWQHQKLAEAGSILPEPPTSRVEAGSILPEPPTSRVEASGFQNSELPYFCSFKLLSCLLLYFVTAA